jgi:purine-binding chemotaxis protein CheW
MAALPPETPAVAAAEGPALAFLAGGEEYALPIASLVEVIRYRAPTTIPGAGEAIEGILPHRGRMVTLVNLRRRFGLPPRPPGSGAQVIVAAVNGEWHGLVVDTVVRVVSGHQRTVELESLVGAGA